MLFEKKLFTGAKLVLPDRVLEASLATRAGVIEGILQPGVKLPGYEEIDVTGKILFPGLVDPHVHMWDPSPLNYREDWVCGLAVRCFGWHHHNCGYAAERAACGGS